MKAVLFYESSADVATLAPIHGPAHGEWWRSFGPSLLMIGTFADPASQGAMGVFTSRDEAERFAAGDPFVVNGVVSSWRVWDWNEILAP